MHGMPGKKSKSLERSGIAVFADSGPDVADLVLAHHRNRLRPQQLGAVEAALMHQHLEEHQIIPPGRVETASAAPELAPWRVRWRDRLQRPVRFALMHADQAWLLRRRDDVIGISHAERGEDVLAKIDLERQPADRFDRSADPIEVDAILPALARVEHQRHPQRGELAGAPRRRARRP